MGAGLLRRGEARSRGIRVEAVGGRSAGTFERDDSPWRTRVSARVAGGPGNRRAAERLPGPIEVGGVLYPSVTHAYWALSAEDPEVRERIRASERPYDAQKIAEEASRVQGWPQARTAVMAGLMRAKYAQHPELAEILLGTGDAPIGYGGIDSDHWITRGDRGRNWVGRLLELVRSDICAQRSGLPLS
ncbi:NADAR family protein [Actinomadura luteofluorescens]|uniref:NADAR family protein n=1 Tax=Actinomadura luteofluorescens TaxID=46163 RepID=UPI003634D22C